MRALHAYAKNDPSRLAYEDNAPRRSSMDKLVVWKPAPSRFFRGCIGVAITAVGTRHRWERENDAAHDPP